MGNGLEKYARIMSILREHGLIYPGATIVRWHPTPLDDGVRDVLYEPIKELSAEVLRDLGPHSVPWPTCCPNIRT
jgi:hypothetical protein